MMLTPHFNLLFLTALIDISECNESIMSDVSETVARNMSYEQLYDRYQRYKLRYDKNKDRLNKVNTCHVCNDLLHVCNDCHVCIDWFGGLP